ncbi:helix-turn-helix domain-containing protein [Epibacterium ulvae]|uniref:helix-turn-helix domain-containing protein n=1 Tax=Epibacterium ulvae TaxID=1156985 RepID=UPI001BFC620F|nr:helix-turn-helix domain-containing protein [Epibacterium ulvae]MBT8152966.1 helix-turn-helix domain-containing protein [Epibacterium ulvae]
MNDGETVETEMDWYGPDMATLGDRIAAARDAANMTQAQLARRLGVKKATLVGWEQDLSEPRANRTSMMAGILNVSIMWLMTGEGEGTSSPEDDSAPQNLRDLLRDLRQLRSEMRENSDRAARLEKRLKTIIEEMTP